MIYTATQYTERPPAVRLEPQLDGSTAVWLAQNIQEQQLPLEPTEETPEPETQTVYQADAAYFVTADPVTQEEIAAAADSWWDYAATWTPEQAAPTVEQRLADAEAAICALMGF